MDEVVSQVTIHRLLLNLPSFRSLLAFSDAAAAPGLGGCRSWRSRCCQPRRLWRTSSTRRSPRSTASTRTTSRPCESAGSSRCWTSIDSSAAPDPGGGAGRAVRVLRVHDLGAAKPAAVPGGRLLAATHDAGAGGRRRVRRPREGLQEGGAGAGGGPDTAVVPGHGKEGEGEGGAWEGEEGEGGAAGHRAGGQGVKLLEAFVEQTIDQVDRCSTLLPWFLPSPEKHGRYGCCC
ncbi:hypothetical protein PVAP13_6KG050035 [Panicum virgatum]|uniref:Uncharacterized protein n=1 Tax=Panicum virgatum TaxID=38727 RepID=A0A8T0RAS0_PANVG|nr:hypothetical protein PVAP13_6KG050035 [Panicum virgatum]